MATSEEIYHRYINYEWNSVSEQLKESILKAIDCAKILSYNEAIDDAFEKIVSIPIEDRGSPIELIDLKKHI